MILYDPFSCWLPLWLFILLPFSDSPTTLFSVSSRDEARHLLHEPRTNSAKGKKVKTQWERGAAVAIERVDILLSCTERKKNVLRHEMLPKHDIHTPVVSGIWAQNVLVVKYLAVLPAKWMGEISCYAYEILQIFTAAECTWGEKNDPRYKMHSWRWSEYVTSWV